MNEPLITQFGREFGLRQIAVALALGLSLALLTNCSNSGSSGGSGAPSENAGGSARNEKLAADVAGKYAALDTSTDSVENLKVTVKDSSGAARVIGLTMYNKRKSDGGRVMFVEFTAPAEERDRDAIIDVDPSGAVQATRYTQSSNTFITAKSPTDEESLFGLTLQELVGGQPEKYDYSLLGEDTYNGTPAYKIEGKIKAGVETRFPRMVMLIDKQNYTAAEIEAYDSQNQLARRLTAEKTEQVDGTWTRMKWRIDNIADSKTLDFEVTSVKYNQGIADTVFDRDHLKKLATKTEAQID